MLSWDTSGERLKVDFLNSSLSCLITGPSASFIIIIITFIINILRVNKRLMN